MRWVVVALLLAGLPSPAHATIEGQSESDQSDAFVRGCGDDSGTDRCDPIVQQQMRERYGIPDSLQALLDDGVTMRRAMFVDGYGNDVVAVTFVRRSGASPTVEIHTPIAKGQESTDPLIASIDSKTWSRVIARSDNFNELLARELPRATDSQDTAAPLSICLHGWMVIAEAVDAERVAPNALAGTGSEAWGRDPALPVEATMVDGMIRSDTESACADGLAFPYAFELASMAYESLPECSTLPRDGVRNEAMLLAQCRRMTGDRFVAGEAVRFQSDLMDTLAGRGGRKLEWLFVGSGTARASLFQSAIDGGTLYLNAPNGQNADRAIIDGSVVYGAQDDGHAAEIADVSLQLLRQTGNFMIDTFEVTNRRPLNPVR